MLSADSSVTFDELVADKNSTRMETADRFLDDLLALAAKGSATSQRAAKILSQWDRQANADSKGAVLFTTWLDQWLEGRGLEAFAKPWDIDHAITTPSGIADPKAALVALDQAVAKVEKSFGAADVAWGDVHRLRYGSKDLPGNGAPGDPYGVFRTAYYVPDEDGKLTITGGDTYYAAIEFGDPVRAKVLLSYGNSTQPGSKHVGDQVPLFSRKEMRDVWRRREEVMAHLEGRAEIK
jgi:acyl-homoserine-lactone acylase